MSEFDHPTPPEHGTPAPDSSDSGMKTVVMNGQTFRVPESMAQAYEAERSAAATPSPVNPQPQATPSEIPPEDEEEFWSNPQAYINKKINDGVNQSVNTFQQSQRAQQAEQAFWDDFYGKNPHLKQIDDYVQFEATKHVDKLKTFNGDTMKIANYIADLGNKALQKFGKTPSTSEVFVEGTPQPSSNVTPTPQDPNKVTSLGDVLKKRREKRRAARLGT